MGYEKEKAIERADRQTELRRTLKINSKAVLDFQRHASTEQPRGQVSNVCAELISAIADGEVNYVTIGKSRDGGSVLITVNSITGSKLYAGGNTWDVLARELDSLFA